MAQSIEARNITYDYDTGNRRALTVKNVSFSVASSDVLWHDPFRS